MRAITHRYEDPLDRVWMTAAARVGLRLRRSAEVYAATDGAGTLTLGAPETLDADDCLAQMIFHELCHSLAQGAASFEREDWGLDNESDRDLAREHACLRVQAVLARRHGLGSVLAPTTDHRAFYDALGPDPLAGDDASVVLARLGLRNAEKDPWAPHLGEALIATAMIVQAAAAHAPPSSLLSRLEPPTPRHPSGLFAHAAPPGTCAECAWRGEHGCQQTGDEVDPRWPGCERFEAAIECGTCGACCREAYAVVELADDDPFAARHPDLVARADGRLELRRVDDRCPPLEGDGSVAAPYRCALYDERPETCRDFTRAEEHCLDARRRVGLSL